MAKLAIVLFAVIFASAANALDEEFEERVPLSIQLKNLINSTQKDIEKLNSTINEKLYKMRNDVPIEAEKSLNKSVLVINEISELLHNLTAQGIDEIARLSNSTAPGTNITDCIQISDILVQLANSTSSTISKCILDKTTSYELLTNSEISNLEEDLLKLKTIATNINAYDKIYSTNKSMINAMKAVQELAFEAFLISTPVREVLYHPLELRQHVKSCLHTGKYEQLAQDFKTLAERTRICMEKKQLPKV